jgi:quinol monooxygenase YgiN
MIYDLHRSTADPALWFLYEHYESQEHLNRHLENPVLRLFVADAATLLDGRLDVRTFKDCRRAWRLNVAGNTQRAAAPAKTDSQ